MNTLSEKHSAAKPGAEVGTSLEPAPPGRPQIRTILVAADASRPSAPAFKYARFIAEQFGSTIVVVYAGPPGGSGGNVDSVEKEICQKIGLAPSRLRAIFLAPGQWTAMEIATAARFENTDLIVLSSDFLVGSKHFFQAGPIEMVVRHAPCPVLVVCGKNQVAASG